MIKHLFLLHVCIGILLAMGCQEQESSVSLRAQNKAKVIYVNSYHQGYGSSDDVQQGIETTLDDDLVDLEIYYLDSKRNPSEEAIKEKIQEPLAAIQETDIDVVIVSDDNAVKYLVVPYLKDGPVPVVFCGVNWSADQYGLPNEHVTGMLEVLPLEESIEILKEHYPDSKSIFILSENTTSERNNKELLDPVYRAQGLNPSYALVDDFEKWKKEFVKANETADFIYLPTNGAIQNWDHEEAISFIRETIKKPVFTCDDFMMPYAVFGLTKIASEQGEWAAETALRIIDGASPSEIPLTRNQRAKGYFNKALSEIIGFEPTLKLRDSLEVIE